MPTSPERPPYPFARPLVPRPEAWLPYLEASYEQRWFTNGGPVATRLEAALAEHVGGGRELVACASATSGITATLLALELRGPVAVPAFTFPATVHAIELAGCTPVFCDIDAAKLELDPLDVQRALHEHDCVAVVHVRAFGFCHDVAPLEQVTRAAGVPLVIDAAAAFGGTTPDGLPVGRSGDAEVFSFHATKVFAVGEGGAISTSPELAARIRHVANFAIDGSDVTRRAINAKLPDVAAAIGLAMLDQLPRHVAVRVAAASSLLDRLAGSDVELPHLAAGRPPLQCLPLLMPARDARARLVDALSGSGIESRSYYCPGLHRATAWNATPAAHRPLPVTDAITERAVALPLYSDLAGAELRHVASALEQALLDAGVAPREQQDRRAA